MINQNMFGLLLDNSAVDRIVTTIVLFVLQANKLALLYKC